MTKARKKQRFTLFRNRSFILFFSLYFIIVIISSYLTCHFSYKQKRDALLSQFDTTYVQLMQKYRDMVDNVWQIYMPIFESNSSIYDTMCVFFNTQNTQDLSPIEKNDLTYALTQMTLRDNEIQWIVVFNPKRDTNYILYNDGTSIKPLPSNFPYAEALLSTSQKMEIYGARSMTSVDSVPNTFAICSSIIPQIGSGKILIGFSNSAFKSICSGLPTDINSHNYVLTNNNQIIFDASGKYNHDQTFCTDSIGINTQNFNGDRLYVKSQACGLSTSIASYYVSSTDLFVYCHSLTPIFLVVVFVFVAASIMGYTVMLRIIRKEVEEIQSGLDRIAENNLDYQIPTNFSQNGFSEIAASINHMTVRIRDNVNRAYYSELKQHEAALSELQSKFNPHFLYNSLEMLRSRCHQNGDSVTAELISQLAAIFRSLISSRTFVSMAEELTFCKRYLALFSARYEDNVKIRYDFDKDILRYGILRNLFQPIIENYFIHGFDASSDENYILFSGKSLDENTMILTVEDNGHGMDAHDMALLNAQLNTPIKLDTESYGLKNLHQRLQLFYGEDYGLSIYPNDKSQKGLRIQIIAQKITCEEYQENQRNRYHA